jgi:hypothetical protein
VPQPPRRPKPDPLTASERHLRLVVDGGSVDVADPRSQPAGAIEDPRGVAPKDRARQPIDWFAARGVTVRGVMTDGAWSYTAQPLAARAARPAPDPPHRQPVAAPSAASRPQDAPRALPVIGEVRSVLLAHCQHLLLDPRRRARLRTVRPAAVLSSGTPVRTRRPPMMSASAGLRLLQS